METTCAVNYLDSDSLLPPRKRLLAGLKRQSPDGNSPVQSISNECDNRLNDLLSSQLSHSNFSNEEIVEASKSAAIEAAKIATAARAAASEKAAKAAKLVAAAKNALELVATLSEDNTDKEKSQKRNKMKRQVPVEALYNKKKVNHFNSRTDEELARNLHRVINSSPRILRNSPDSEMKSHKHKRLKRSVSFDKSNMYNGVPLAEGTSNGSGVIGNLEKIDMIMVDLKTSKSDKSGGQQGFIDGMDELNLENSEGLPSIPSKDKVTESLDKFGKKRGKLKQKKLPLSICSFRDQSSPKEEMKTRGKGFLEDKTGRTVEGNESLLQAESSGNTLIPAEKTTVWKCKAFKAPACVKQNKVMQS